MSRSFATRAMKLAALTAAATGVMALPGVPAFAGDAYLNVHGTTRVGENVSLIEGTTVLDDRVGNITQHTAKEIARNGSSDWKTKSFGNNRQDAPAALQINLSYHLLDRQGKPSPYWVKAYFRTPVSGYNSAGCTIIKKEEGKEDREVHDAPFVCGWSNFGKLEWNPQPILDIKGAIGLTDKAEGAKLLERYCKDPINNVHCSYDNTTVKSWVGKSTKVSTVYRNTTDEPGTQTVTWEHTTAMSHTAGAEFKFEFSDVAKTMAASVALKYEFTYTSQDTKSETDTLTVPARSAAWFEHGAALVTITGDWVINADGQAWLIPDTSFTFPDPDDQGVLSACSGSLTDWQVHNTCRALDTQG